MSRPSAETFTNVFRGTAAMLRRVFVLAEAGLDTPDDPAISRRRRTTIAEAGYSARAIASFTAAVREGTPRPWSQLSAEREDRVAIGASMPSAALLHLVEHSSIHLRVEWRDLPAGLWTLEVADIERGPASPLGLLGERAREVWRVAVALGASEATLPAALACPVHRTHHERTQT